jgi:hypothetical protein
LVVVGQNGGRFCQTIGLSLRPEDHGEDFGASSAHHFHEDDILLIKKDDTNLGCVCLSTVWPMSSANVKMPLICT